MKLTLLILFLSLARFSVSATDCISSYNKGRLDGIHEVKCQLAFIFLDNAEKSVKYWMDLAKIRQNDKDFYLEQADKASLDVRRWQLSLKEKGCGVK